MDSIFQNDWNALSDDLFLPMFNSRKVFNFKRLFSKDDSIAASAPPTEKVFVKTLDIKGWEPSEIELVVTADGKQLIVSGNKEEEEKRRGLQLETFQAFR